ncbi:MAG: PHP domain-containing protein, partial [Lachnospiraceae bacterium]|nr:PHP domain-containing protein [Lachnospiraceae bacterium]
MKAVDLHTHSNASDGSLTPSELMDLAREKGLSAIALTDHDTIDGIREAAKRAEEIRAEGYDLELIPGIEFSSEYEGQDIHIVGLYIDIDNAFLLRRLSYFIESREKRNRRMCELLSEHGVPLSYEELKAEFPDSVITRAHYGRLLVKKGYVKSMKEAFDRYIGDGRPCFIPRKKISPVRAIEIIRKAGGFPVFAHPVLCHMSSARLSTLVEKLKNAGLLGIEALYGTYESSDERDMRRLAEKFSLVISGGSDFHGKAKPGIDLGSGTGRLFIAYSVLDRIKEAHNKMLQTNGSWHIPKVLFTDLDDTLLKTDKSISDYTFDVLKRFTDAGNFLVLNSGRDCNS